tara:strand:+ start:207 stop:368 length:162 start_codon:yes stop_codon:yes gene_type:complete
LIELRKKNDKSSSVSSRGYMISAITAGLIARLFCSSGLALLLWVAAAWAMGWF